MDIFVSYTSKDKAWAFWIGHELQRLGHKPRIHDWEIPGGGDIMEWMEAGIKDSERVLCILSVAYLAARYSSWERRAASWAAASGRSNFVLPVFIEDCEPPLAIAQIKHCNLFGLTEDQARDCLAEFLRKPDDLERPAFPVYQKSATATAQMSGSNQPKFPVPEPPVPPAYDKIIDHNIRLYISHNYYDAESIEWVEQAKAFLSVKFEVYDSWARPGLKRDVSDVSSVSDCNVIICLLSRTYYEMEVFRDEFEAAVKQSTGSMGSLSKQRFSHIVYVMALDIWAERWLRKNHPKSSNMPKELYRFAPSPDDSPLPINPQCWEALTANIEQRVKAFDRIEVKDWGK